MTTAQDTLEEAHAALLDEIAIPESVGLGSAVYNLKKVKAQGLEWLDEWEQAAGAFSSDNDGVEVGDFKKSLGSIGLGKFAQFPFQVYMLYWALSLDTRGRILTLLEAGLSNPGQTFAQLQHSIQTRLADNAEAQERLKSVLWSLAETQLNSGRVPIPGRRGDAGMIHRKLTRLARAIEAAPKALPLLTSDNRVAIEVVQKTDGSLVLLSPK